MAVVVNGIETSKGIRDVLKTFLSNDTDTDNTRKLYITLGDGKVQVEEVDLVWDGGEYYIQCIKTNSKAEGIFFYKLDSVLPLVIETISSSGDGNS